MILLYILLALAAIVLLCALSAVYISGVESAEVVARKRELPIYCVDRSDNMVAISFDAAWGDVRVRQINSVM